MRNVYLTGAKELADGINPLPMTGGRNADLAATLPLKDWFDAFAVRLNPDRSRGHNLMLNFSIDGQPACVSVARQTEFARIDFQCASPDATVTIQLPVLEAIISGNQTLEEAEAAGARSRVIEINCANGSTCTTRSTFGLTS